MKIAIDTRCIEWQRGGVSRFLVKYLELCNSYLPNQKYVLYFQNNIPNDTFLNHPNFQCKIIKGPRFFKKRRIICEQFLLPIQLYFDSIDILISPWYTSPWVLLKTKLILCLWDISFLTNPDHYNVANRISLGFFAKKSARKAEKIITCSHFDSVQIQNYFNFDSSKILVLNFPAESKFNVNIEQKLIDNEIKKLNISYPYILSLGVIYNRRNIPTLIDSFELLLQKGIDIKLVIVGRNETIPKFNFNQRLNQLIKSNKVIYLDYIDEEYLIPIYKGASLYYCSSDVDGEAILLKEAMLSGTPILSSNMLKFATNNFGTYVSNPKDKYEIANSIEYILNNKEKIKIKVDEGLKWVSEIKWENAIKETTNLFK